MTTCRVANDYDSSVVPVVKGRQVEDIPKDEIILRDYARRLSLLLKEKSNRQRIYMLFKNSPNVSNAVSLKDVGGTFNLKVTYKYAPKVNVSIPWPEHREKFFKDPNGALYVAYAPLAEDMDVEKIVAFRDGEPILLDAWEPPDVPVVVLSFEPIVKSEQNTLPDTSRTVRIGDNQHSPSKTTYQCYDRFVAVKVLKINGRLPEGWWLWPMEIYLIHNWGRIPTTPPENDWPEAWITMWHSGRWYWYSIDHGVDFWNGDSLLYEPGLGDPMSFWRQRVSFVLLYEDDSHPIPHPEWGSDDFWGGRGSFSLPYVYGFINDPNDSRLWGVTLWKNGHAGGFFKAYHRCKWR